MYIFHLYLFRFKCFLTCLNFSAGGSSSTSLDQSIQELDRIHLEIAKLEAELIDIQMDLKAITIESKEQARVLSTLKEAAQDQVHHWWSSQKASLSKNDQTVVKLVFSLYTISKYLVSYLFSQWLPDMSLAVVELYMNSHLNTINQDLYKCWSLWRYILFLCVEVLVDIIYILLFLYNS